jgi:hypothetical protein
MSMPSMSAAISSFVTTPLVSTNSVAQSAPTMVVHVLSGAEFLIVNDSSVNPYSHRKADDTASPSAPFPRNCANITRPLLPRPSTSSFSFDKHDNATPTSCPFPPTPTSHRTERWTFPGSRFASGGSTNRF